MSILIDSSYPIETPEAVEIGLHPVGPVARSLAYLIDFAILVMATALFATTISAADTEIQMGLFALFSFFAQWFYPVFGELFFKGRTVGKWALGMRVAQLDGMPLGWSHSLLRNLLRIADFMPFCFFSGVISMLFTPRFQRLGDLVAGTVVVYDLRPDPKPKLERFVPLQPPVPLRLSEQRAFIAFAERSPRFNPYRAAELAEFMQALHHAKGYEAVERMNRYAAWLSGGTS